MQQACRKWMCSVKAVLYMMNIAQISDVYALFGAHALFEINILYGYSTKKTRLKHVYPTIFLQT